MRTTLIAFAAAALSAPLAAAQIEAHPVLGQDFFLVSGDIRDLAVADLAVDGVPEILLTRRDTAELLVFSGAGQLRRAVPLDVAPGPMTVLDADGDGLLDVLVAGAAGLEAQLLRGLGDGEAWLEPQPPFTIPAVPHELLVGDFENDGDLDALMPATSSLTTRFVLLRNDGGGAFTRTTTAAPGADILDNLFADLDADGLLDVLNDGRHLYRGMPQGTFLEAGLLPGLPSFVSEPVLTDMTDDGAADLLIQAPLLFGDQQTQVLAGPVPDLGPPVVVAEHGLGTPLVADWSADGLPDVITYDGLRGRPGDLPEPWDLATGFRPESMVAAFGDVDGDGAFEVVDLVELASGSTRVNVRSMPPDADLDQSDYPFIPNGAVELLLLDLDGDGDDDVLGFPTAGTTRILMNNGDGTTTEVPNQLLGLVDEDSFVDRDLDGDLDVLSMGGLGTPYVAYLEGQGDGTFQQTATALLGAPMDRLTTGDLDEDGLVDAVVASTAGAGWQRLLGPALQPEPLEPEPLGAVGLGDFDGDGHLDLAAAAPLGDVLELRLGDGRGSFGAPGMAAAAPRTAALRVADMDLDGALDVVSAGRGLAITPGLGDGSFGAPSLSSLSLEARSLKLVDLDQDGLLEALTFQGLAVALRPGDGAPLEEFLLPFVPGVTWQDVTDEPGLEWVAGTRVLTPRPTAPWIGLGNALAGSAGFPRLAAAGRQNPGEATRLWVAGGPPSGLAFLVLGATDVSAPFRGGTLVPSPDLVLGLPLDARGSTALSLPWPDGLSGLTLWWQAWMPDPAGPLGFSATNALVGTAP